MDLYLIIGPDLNVGSTSYYWTTFLSVPTLAHLHVPEVCAHVVGVVAELDGNDGAVAHRDLKFDKTPIYITCRR